MAGWENQRLESRLLGEISITLDMQMADSEELKSLLMKVKEESEKFRKLRSWHLVPSLHGK